MSSLDMSSFVSIRGLPENVGFATFFKRLYDSRLNTDVDFDLLGPEGPVTFSAHKMILSLWSPHFADKFYSSKDNKNVVNILQYKDVNPEAFEAMLKFMYGCKPALENPKKACALYKVARDFEVSSLQDMCRQFLNDLKMEPSVVFELLDASEYMGNRSRIDTCHKLIQEQTREILEAYDLSEISSSRLNTILDSPKMSLSGEYDLLKWVYSWAKNKLDRSNHYSNVREVLEQYLPKLNFLALTNKEFAVLRSQWENFFTLDESLSIFMNIGERGLEKMPDWYDENRPFRIYNVWNVVVDQAEVLVI